MCNAEKGLAPELAMNGLLNLRVGLEIWIGSVHVRHSNETTLTDCGGSFI